MSGEGREGGARETREGRCEVEENRKTLEGMDWGYTSLVEDGAGKSERIASLCWYWGGEPTPCDGKLKQRRTWDGSTSPCGMQVSPLVVDTAGLGIRPAGVWG